MDIDIINAKNHVASKIIDYVKRYERKFHNDMKIASIFISERSYITMEFISANPDFPWNWKFVSQNPNLTIKFIEYNPDLPWDFKKV